MNADEKKTLGYITEVWFENFGKQCGVRGRRCEQSRCIEAVCQTLTPNSVRNNKGCCI